MMTSIATLKRRADRLGYGFRKSGRRTFSAHDQLEYMLFDVARNLCVAGANYDLTIGDVAEWIAESEVAA